MIWSEAEDSSFDSDDLGERLGDYTDDEHNAGPAPSYYQKPEVIAKTAKKARKAARKEGDSSNAASSSTTRQEVVPVSGAASDVVAGEDLSHAAPEAGYWPTPLPADRWTEYRRDASRQQ